MNKKAKNGQAKPLFIVRAERSMRRVARKVRAESRRLGRKPVVFK